MKLARLGHRIKDNINSSITPSFPETFTKEFTIPEYFYYSNKYVTKM